MPLPPLNTGALLRNSGFESEWAKPRSRRDAIFDVTFARMVRIGCNGCAAAIGIITFATAAAAGPAPSGALFSTTPTTVFTASRPYRTVIDDFDGDGNRDVLVDELSKLTLYYMNADFTVRESVSYTGETLPLSAPIDQLYLEQVDSIAIDAADMTGDGLPEVILVEEIDVRVLKVSPSGFQMLTNTTAVDYAPLTATGHFAGGAAEQLVLEPTHDTAPYELQVMNLSANTLVETQRLAEAGITEKSSAGFLGHPMGVTDLNGDGRDDLVYPGVQSAVVRLQAASGGLGAATTLALGGDLLDVTAGDFDGDTRTDLALVSNYPSELRTFLQTTPGVFVESGTAMPSRYPLYAADLDGDGSAELVGATSVLWRDGTTWVAGESLSIGQTAYLQSVEDWDGDGLLDVVVRDATSVSVAEGELRILRGQQAKLSVAFVESTEAIAGEPFDATFEVRNDGPSATGVIATTVSAADPSRAEQLMPACTAGTTGGCDIPSLDPGQTSRVTVRSYPSANTTEQVSISVRGATWDPDLSDNTADVSIPVSPRADLGGQASLWIDENTIDLPITLGNSGPSIAQNVKAVIQLPEGISDATWTSNPPATCSQSGLELTCTIGELSPSTGMSLDIKGGFSYHNQSVQVSGDISSDTIDPDATNNHFAQALPANFLAGLPGSSPDNGGCGCTIAAKRRALPAVLIGAVGLFVQRRRRRRR